MEKQYRKIVFHKNYFLEFYADLDDKVKDKIRYAFKVIETTEIVPSRFLKHMSETKGLYEVRVEHQGNIYRIFCCFDEGKLVVLFNAFQKKTQKTPKKEIDMGMKLKDEYFKQKNKTL